MSLPLINEPRQPAVPIWTVSQLTAEIKNLLETE